MNGPGRNKYVYVSLYIAVSIDTKKVKEKGKRMIKQMGQTFKNTDESGYTWVLCMILTTLLWVWNYFKIKSYNR